MNPTNTFRFYLTQMETQRALMRQERNVSLNIWGEPLVRLDVIYVNVNSNCERT